MRVRAETHSSAYLSNSRSAVLDAASANSGARYVPYAIGSR
jgi:hypothetical protein